MTIDESASACRDFSRAPDAHCHYQSSHSVVLHEDHFKPSVNPVHFAAIDLLSEYNDGSHRRAI
jgi:hypothetical protein